MTSIVERLRNPAFLPVKDANMELRLAAADEIERLKAQAVTDWIKHGEEIERLRELVAALQLVATSHEPEINRLHASLNTISHLADDEVEMGCSGYDHEQMLMAVAIARRALEPKP